MHRNGVRSASLLVCAPLLLATASPPERATVDPRTRDDIKCLIVAAMLSGEKDEEVSTSAAMGMQYFFGRIDGRSPGLNLEEAVAAETAKLTEEEFGRLVQSCGRTMESRGNYFRTVGEKLEKRPAD